MASNFKTSKTRSFRAAEEAFGGPGKVREGNVKLVSKVRLG